MVVNPYEPPKATEEAVNESYPVHDDWRYISISAVLFWETARVYRSSWAFLSEKQPIWDMRYTGGGRKVAVRRGTGESISLKESKSTTDWDIAEVCYLGEVPMFEFFGKRRWQGREPARITFLGCLDGTPPIEWSTNDWRWTRVVDRSQRLSVSVTGLVGFREISPEVGVGLALIWDRYFDRG